MSTSTSSLFHYTRSLDTLKAILDVGLWPNYCKEMFRSARGEYMIGIPMVSFCDIPLSRTADFCERYGYYGIALRKEWGIKRGINSVLYVTNDNIYHSLSFYNTVERVWRKNAEGGGIDVGKNAVKFTLNQVAKDGKDLADGCNAMLAKGHNNTLAGFLKPYSITKDDGSNQGNYMESEWRYIVSDTDEIPWLRSEDEFNNWRGERDKPKPEPSDAIKEKKLTFSVDDITHIIIKGEVELIDIINNIRDRDQLCGQPMDETGKLKLLSKIRCMDRINLDF